MLGVNKGVSWGVLDQALSSTSNFLCTVLVLRASGPRDFGEFALWFAAYVVLLNIARAVSSYPLMIRSISEESKRAATRGTVIASLVVSVPVVLWSVGQGGLAPGPLALAGLPVLLLADNLRYRRFSEGTPRSACQLDGAWLGIQVTLLLLVASVSTLTPTLSVACWLTGCIGALIAAPRTKDALRGGTTGGYLSHHWPVIRGLLAEAVFGVALTQGAAVLLAAVTTLATLGNFRAATTITAPIFVISSGLFPILSREARQAPTATALDRLILSYGCLLALSGAAITLCLRLAPTDVITAIFGSTAAAARPLLVAVGVLATASTLAQVAAIGLRVRWTTGQVAWVRIATGLGEGAVLVTIAASIGVLEASWMAGGWLMLAAVAALLAGRGRPPLATSTAERGAID